MGVAARIWAIRAVAVAVLVALWPVARVFELPEVKVIVPGMVAVVGGYLLAERWVVRALWRELPGAPKVRAEEILEALQPLQAGDPYATARLAFERAALVSKEGRYAEARTLLEGLLESQFVGPMLPSVQNNLAWALMHLGITKRALELSALALKAGPNVGYFRGTYAIGVYLDGRAAEAVPLIEGVLAGFAGDGAVTQAIRAYYLGEALEVVGRRDDARVAYERALREAPQSRWAEAAKVKLG
ncbi:MAG: tetratricopeptide repeat protein [Myxococcaceae bacterium]|nr:tetratricopeptide repeat protein [Myxococcaceae bacterium]